MSAQRFRFPVWLKFVPRLRTFWYESENYPATLQIFRYNSFLDVTPVENIEDVADGTNLMKLDGKLCQPTRLANGLYRFKPDTGFDRAVLDCITSLKNGADLLWIETPNPHVAKMAKLVNAVRQEVPNAKLVYNNSPSFNWTLNFRQQVFDEWKAAGKTNLTDR